MARKPSKPATRRRSTKGGGGSTSRKGKAKASRAPTVYTGTSKRVRDYLKKHPHATVAQARGHKPHEHRTRKERARAAGRFDENQRAALLRFAKLQAPLKEGGPDSDELYRAMLVRLDGRPEGWAQFLEMKRRVEHYAKQKRHRDRIRRVDKSGKVVTIEMKAEPIWHDMDDFAAELDIPVEWIYYHR